MKGILKRKLGPTASLPKLAPITVIASLLLLAVVPVVMHAHIRALRTEITDVADPARVQVTYLQLAMVTKNLEAGAFSLTWDSLYAGLFQQSLRKQNEILAELLPLANRLPDPIPAQAEEVNRIFHEADPVLNDLITGKISLETYVNGFLAEQAMYTRANASLVLLYQSISDFVTARRESILRTERMGTAATGTLVFLALVSVAVVARLVKERSWASTERERLLRAERRARRVSDKARAVANEQRRELERVTESRAALVRGFSHDVKNPLGAADGFLEMLESGYMGQLTQRQKDGVTSARRSLASALGLIEDLLELAHAQEFAFERDEVDLRMLVSQLVHENRARAEAKGLRLAAELPDASQTIHTDGRRVHQIVGNLIANAIKYTSRGAVTVQVQTWMGTHAGRDGLWKVVRVCDTGGGISDDQRRFLFREFHRLNTSRGTQGDGIGLAISRRLALALGGDLTVATKVGSGSRFVLWLYEGAAAGGAQTRAAG